MDKSTNIFQKLDRAFWAVWAACPIAFGYAVYYIVTEGIFMSRTDPGASFPITKFSLMGKLLASSYIGLNTILYILLFLFIHILINQFRRGNIFVRNTLTYMHRIAWLLLAWPFVEIIQYNLVAFGLDCLGDVPNWEPSYFIDLTFIALGLVILALRLVIHHAIKLHKDMQYTV